MEDSEFNDLFEQINELKTTLEKEHLSTAGIIENVITNLPEQAEAVATILNNFNPSQFKDVIDFARYANGGRDINTNESIVTPIPKIMQKADK